MWVMMCEEIAPYWLRMDEVCVKGIIGSSFDRNTIVWVFGLMRFCLFALS